MGCIYKITNTVNGKSYIGQTIYNAEKTRIRQHLNRRSRGSKLVKQAIEKYGKEAFVYEILHDGIIPAFLDALEIEAIEMFNTVAPHGYNLSTGGSNGRPSEETRRKISKSVTKLAQNMSEEERRQVFGSTKGKTPWNKGKTGHLSKDALRKMSEAHKGQTSWMKGKKHTAESRQKMSQALKGRKHSDKTKEKMSQAHKGRPSSMKGKNHSAETLRKMSEIRTGEKNPRFSPMHLPTKAFYFSLPSDMSMKEKRKRVKDFCDKDAKTVWRWIRKWQSELDEKS